MKSISIKMRLILTLGFLSLLLIVVGVFGLNGMGHAIHGLETVYSDRLIPTGQLSKINDLMRSNIQQLQFGSQHDPRLKESALHEATHTVAKHADAIDKGVVEITALWKVYISNHLTAEEKVLADEFAKKRKHYVDQLRIGQAQLRGKDFQEGNMHAVQALAPSFNEAKKEAEKLLQLQVDVAEAEFSNANDDYDFARNLSIGSIITGLLLSLITGYALIRAITQPLNRAVDVTKAIADGDLNQNIEVGRDDETGQLLYALRDMNDKLREIVGSVITAADEVTDGAGEISRGNLDLSQRTEEQASSLEETAASMEEMTSTVNQNASNARQANQLALGASEQAVQGGEVVSNAINAMTDISASSNKISDIIGVIDEIAFQTNLLALNAAVEAARAGEQGRGFAVVAGEVRTLAGRSAEAAKEIKGLIKDSVDKVDLGSKLVNESGDTLSEIVDSVKKVSDIIAEIAAAGQEQTSGIEQINEAITQMDDMTQQNAALVEEAAAASQSMEDQAKGLSAQVAFFNVSGSSVSQGRTTPKVETHHAPAKRATATRKTTQAVAPKPTPKSAPKATMRPAAKRAPEPAKPMASQRNAVDDDEWEDF